MKRDQDPRELFDDAYQGKALTNAMDDFHRRVRQRHVILEQIGDPELWFWTPAFHNVLSWLQSRYPPGTTVLEVGCGLGFFLHALRNLGYNAVGLDVAQTVVDINRGDGFDVWHGPIESLPPGWVNPDVVVGLFMFHHIENPLRFLQSIKDYAPGASIVLAVYGPSNKGGAASFPPRTLIRWNGRALQAALERVGYTVAIRDIASTGAERGAVRRAREVMAGALRVPWLYRLGKRVEAEVLRHVPLQARSEAYVVLAMAEPASA